MLSLKVRGSLFQLNVMLKELQVHAEKVDQNGKPLQKAQKLEKSKGKPSYY